MIECEMPSSMNYFTKRFVPKHLNEDRTLQSRKVLKSQPGCKEAKHPSGKLTHVWIFRTAMLADACARLDIKSINTPAGKQPCQSP